MGVPPVNGIKNAAHAQTGLCHAMRILLVPSLHTVHAERFAFRSPLDSDVSPAVHSLYMYARRERTMFTQPSIQGYRWRTIHVRKQKFDKTQRFHAHIQAFLVTLVDV